MFGFTTFPDFIYADMCQTIISQPYCSPSCFCSGAEKIKYFPDVALGQCDTPHQVLAGQYHIKRIKFLPTVIAEFGSRRLVFLR